MIHVNALIMHVVLTPSDVNLVGVTGKVEYMFFLFSFIERSSFNI